MNFSSSQVFHPVVNFFKLRIRIHKLLNTDTIRIRIHNNDGKDKTKKKLIVQHFFMNFTNGTGIHNIFFWFWFNTRTSLESTVGEEVEAGEAHGEDGGEEEGREEECVRLKPLRRGNKAQACKFYPYHQCCGSASIIMQIRNQDPKTVHMDPDPRG